MTKKKSESRESRPWVEKYRPTKLKYVIGNKDIIDQIQAHLDDDSVQNVELIGGAGIGKTTIAICMAEVLTNRMADNLKFVNASMWGTKGFLKSEIIPFCRNSTLGSGKKVIILDEFDHASPAMQASFRRVMEDFTKDGNCVFILTCNYPRKIIVPIHSRCAKYRLRNVPVDELVERGRLILKKEKMEFSEEDLERIAESSGGKPRDFIQMLQQNCVGWRLTVPPQVEYKSDLAEMLRFLLKKEFRNLESAIDKYQDIVGTFGDDAREMIVGIHELILSNKRMSDDMKGKILRSIAETDYRLSVDTNTTIQVVSMLVTFYFIATPYLTDAPVNSSERTKESRAGKVND